MVYHSQNMARQRQIVRKTTGNKAPRRELGQKAARMSPLKEDVPDPDPDPVPDPVPSPVQKKAKVAKAAKAKAKTKAKVQKIAKLD